MRMQGWIEPPAVMQVEAGSGNVSRTPIQPPPPADFSEMDEVRLYAPGHDGVKIPVTLIYRKSTRLDRTTPRCSRPTAATASRFRRASTRRTSRGSSAAASSPWPTCAAAASTAGNGIRPAAAPAKVNTILDALAVSEFLVSYGFTNPRQARDPGRERRRRSRRAGPWCAAPSSTPPWWGACPSWTCCASKSPPTGRPTRPSSARRRHPRGSRRCA